MRYTIGVLLAPALVATLISASEVLRVPAHLRSQAVNLIPAYFMLTYAVAVLPTSIGIAAVVEN